MAAANDDSGAPNAAPSNFIRDIIDADRADGRYGGRVVTRFPPEPNGYLHIGHAKSICLNFSLAQTYGGQCHLRMDDTNPTTEDQEFVEAIQNDVRWLGFDWGSHFYHASDYFERLYTEAQGLIRRGKAYVCSLNEEQVRDYRGTVTEPGRPSPDRDRDPDESLALFEKMRAGAFAEGQYTLRAKIDMAAPNMKLRDPPLYRIRHAAHYRAGERWSVYPMYDFAHCLSDAYEGITHSLCTLEFENNRALYDWILEASEAFDEPPKQYEFARLSITYTVLSKRQLLRLVRDQRVDGWDDPRMPTLAGLRRRGVPPEAIRNFCDRLGVSKANSTAEVGQLEHSIRDVLNHEAPRVLAVLDPLPVEITNYPDDQEESLDASYWPHDVPKTGTRPLPFSKRLYIERDDFREDPPKKFFRLAPGREVRLRYSYVIKCEEVVRDAAGNVTGLRCTYDPETLGRNPPDGRKVKGTLHWVSAAHARPAQVRLYDRLFQVERPDLAEGDLFDHLNPESLVVRQGWVEPSLGDAQKGDTFQFERHGYFCVDSNDASEGLVCNRTVSLKDSWGKLEAAAAPARPASPTKPPAPAASSGAPAARPERTPEQESHFLRLTAAGISPDDADTLSRRPLLQRLFDEGLAAHGNGPALATWLVNTLQGLVKDREDVALDGARVGRLVALVGEGAVSSTGGKQVLTEMLTSSDAPEVLIDRLGLRQIQDPEALAQEVQTVLSQHAASVEKYRAGKTNVLGFLVGQVMRATGGKADPKQVSALLRKALES